MRVRREGNVWLCESHTTSLNEMTYKDITKGIDGNFLRQQVRAAVLTGVKLGSINSDEHLMLFKVDSAEKDKNGIIYDCAIRFKDWDYVVDDTEYKPIERARLLMFEGDLELNCTCPSFLYWGYRYILTQLDASIVPEDRPPNVRNPQLRGVVCKHLNRVIKAFPFYSGDLAHHIRINHEVAAGATRDWDIKSKVAELLKKNPSLKANYDDIQ